MLELYYKKRWEGKSLGFKIRYMYANYPGVTISVFAFTVLPVVIGGYRFYNFKGSRLDAMKKYKIDYKVVRDDDPNLSKILADKELGREHFPTY